MQGRLKHGTDMNMPAVPGALRPEREALFPVAIDGDELDAQSVMIDALYAALEDQARWPSVIALLGELLSLRVLLLTCLGGTTTHRPVFLEAGMDGARRRAYEAGGWRDDPFRHAVRAPWTGHWQVLNGHAVAPEALRPGHPWLESVLPGSGGAQVRALAITPAAPMSVPVMILAVRRLDDPPFDARFDTLLGEVGRHLVRIESLAFRQATASMLRPGVVAAGAFLLDADGQIVACDPAAAELLALGVFDATGNTLKPSHTDAASWLYGRLAQVRSGQLTLSDVHDGMPLPRSRVARLELIAAPRLASSPALMRARCLLSISARPDQASGRRGHSPAMLFGWTPTEADIVERLAEGGTVLGIAQARRCSIETVRSHLKSAKRKAGVARQVDLVRLCLVPDAAQARLAAM